MAEPDRTAAELVALLNEIELAPHEFDFYQALRRLECAAADAPRLGESARAKDDPIRLGQDPSMAFAPRTLNGLERDDAHHPPRMDVLFFGLFGPNGPMPIHLTEYCRNRLHQHNDPTLARFADIFHHRLLSLFYRAWANAQPAVHLDRPDSDRFAAYVGSLAGLGVPTMRNRDEVPDHAKFYFAGRLSSGGRHPEGLQAMLADYFGVPVRIDEFVGRWTEIPASSRCVLGVHSDTALLGMSSTIGDCVWDCQQTFRIVLGPLSFAQFRRFLPGGRSLPHVVDLVRNYLGEELLWDLQLILRKEQAPSACLGESGLLGMAAWLEPESLTADADDFDWNSQYDVDLMETVNHV
jgi:type VI secretion system protein ImpH